MLSYGWRRFLLMLVLGALAGTSVPPLFILPALFVTFPFWVWALDGAERRRGLGLLFGPAFSIGFAFGWGYFIVAFHWLGAAFFIEGGAFLALMPVAILALSALIALFWGLASALAHLFWSHGAWRIVTLAVFLSASEYARGTFFSGFPFALLGYALTANIEMMQLSATIGVYGLTLIAALLAMTPALIWPADGRGMVARLVPFFLAIAAIAGQIGYGNYRLNATEVPPGPGINARLVQPIITEHSNWAAANPPEIVSRLIEVTGNLTGKDIVVWPESVFPFFLSVYPEGLARIARMLPPETTLITGAPREPEILSDEPSDNPGYNSILVIDTNGEVVASYDKSHLVPFGEYLPFAQFWKLFGITQFVPGTNGWAPGDGKRLVTPAGLPGFIALVCYEAIFSGDLGADPAKADYILNISNDEWFDGSIGPAQHAHHALLRAVETGLPMLRATNSGVTFAADPMGRIVSRLAPYQPGFVDVDLPGKLETTPFARYGNWPFLGALGVGLLLALITRSRKPRRA